MIIKWSRSKIKAGLKQIQVFARFVFPIQSIKQATNAHHISTLQEFQAHNHLLTSFLCP